MTMPGPVAIGRVRICCDAGECCSATQDDAQMFEQVAHQPVLIDRDIRDDVDYGMSDQVVQQPVLYDDDVCDDMDYALSDQASGISGLDLPYSRGAALASCRSSKLSEEELASQICGSQTSHFNSWNAVPESEERTGNLEEEQGVPVGKIRTLMRRMNSKNLDAANQPQRRSQRGITKLKDSDSSIDLLSMQLVSFGENEALLRASRLSTVMRRGGRVFAKSIGTAADYNLSEEVTEIDAFISHNWSVHRVHKFFCLAMYFNFYQALLITAVAVAASGFGTLVGVLPRLVIHKGTDEPGCVGLWLVPSIFIMAVCYGHKLRQLLICRSPAVFLDKACIHQTDAALQREGILKLGAFIANSKHMVVVYTDIYLAKLWTVYEVACFLSLHPSSKMAIVLPFIPLMIMGGVFLASFSRALRLLLQWAADPGHSSLSGANSVEVLSNLVIIFVGSLLLRRLARTREGIRLRLFTFDLENCICSCEEDRAVVYRNISLLMRATGEVNPFASNEDAFLAFNSIVRKRLSGPLLVSVGLGYWHCVAIYMFGIFPVYFDSYMGIHPFYTEDATLTRISLTLSLCAWPLGVMPLLGFVLMKWCRCRLYLTGWCEYLFLLLGCFLTAIFTIMLQIAMNMVYELHVHGIPGVIAIVICDALFICVAGAAYAMERHQQINLKIEDRESDYHPSVEESQASQDEDGLQHTYV